MHCHRNSIALSARLGLFVLAAVLLVVHAHPVGADTNYSRTIDLPAIRISYLDLQSVLNKGASLVAAANGRETEWNEEVTLRNENLEIRITGHDLSPTDAKLPTQIDRFRYTGYARDSHGFPTDNVPISRIIFDFADYNRSLIIAGRSPEQVDAVLSALRDDLLSQSTALGGSSFRAAWGAIVFILGAMALIFCGLLWNITKQRLLLVPLVLSVLVLFGLYFLPNQLLFAGFLAVRGDAGIVVRYGPQISLLGLLVSIVFGVVSMIPLIFGRTEKPAKLPASNQPTEAMAPKE